MRLDLYDLIAIVFLSNSCTFAYIQKTIINGIEKNNRLIGQQS